MSKPYQTKAQEYRMLILFKGDQKLSIYKGTLKGIQNYKDVKILFKETLK